MAGPKRSTSGNSNARTRNVRSAPAGIGTRQNAGGTLQPFVIWDIVSGAGGNVLTALHRLKDVPAHLHIVSLTTRLARCALRWNMPGRSSFPSA